MERLPLLGGSYLARSIIASPTRCVNYYPEINPKDSLVPMTYYQRPGLKVAVRPGTPAPARDLYRASNSDCFAVIGQELFLVDAPPGWTLTSLGSITLNRGNPVSMTDNGQAMMLVDGSSDGWMVQLQPFFLPTTGNSFNTDIVDNLASIAGVPIGAEAAGPNIPAGTTVVSFPSPTSAKLSANCTATVASFTGSIAGNVLTASAVTGTITVGATLFDVSGNLVANTKIVNQLGGAPGGAGTYTTDGVLQTVLAEAMTCSSGGQQAISFSAPKHFFSQISDPTGIFTGADKVDTIDTFVLWNIPDSKRFGSTTSGAINFDATQFAAKTDYPDLLVTLIVNRHEILLLGSLKSEIWYDAGNPTFPFAELPGAYIEHGTVAKYSVASEDISVFWLGQDLQGQGVVFRQRGYLTTRISNHALERKIRQMAEIGTISDAIGMTYQIEGHVFYVLTFPSGDETWVYDDSIQDPMMAWHQESWTDRDGLGHRHRMNCVANFYGRIVAGDWENGTLYELDLETYTDEVDGQIGPITFIRTFPHIGQARGPGNQLIPVNGRRLAFHRFWLDLECGTAPLSVDGQPAMISLRWSDDRGRTYGNDVLQSSGELGQYLTQPQWPGLGIARDRIFEISHSIAGPAALNGAWVDAELLDLD